MAKGVYIGVKEENLVANGDFESGISGWATAYSDYLTLSTESSGYKGKCFKITVTKVQTTSAGGGAYCSIGHAVTVVANHVYYASGYYKGATTNISYMRPQLRLEKTSGYVGSSSYGDGQNTTWQKLSLYGTSSETGAGRIVLMILAGYNNGDITTGMYLNYDNIRVYDLTAIYGAGNEPTKEWCDSNETALENLCKAGGVARKVKKMYIGVDGKARKIKKGYIGVGGVARLFYSSEKELSYYGTIASLSETKTYLAATTVGDYAIFAGGNNSKKLSSVDGYSKTLTKETVTALPNTRQYISATSTGDYALFGLGSTGSTAYSADVDTYNSSLSKGTATSLSVGRTEGAAATVGDYALFAGGRTAASTPSSVVDSYNSDLSKGTPTSLSSTRWQLAATNAGNYALFGGGKYDSVNNPRGTVDAYNTSCVRTIATALTDKRYQLAAATTGEHALFAGGYRPSSSAIIVESYTSSLVQGTPAALSVSRYVLNGASADGYALFAGGFLDGTGAQATVDVYNKELVKSTATDLSVARYSFASATTGDYIIFGGGMTASGAYSAAVDVYKVS